MEREINRRDFLRYGAVTASAAILAACSPSEQKRIKREVLSYRLGQDRPTLQAMKTEEAKNRQDTQAPIETAIAQRVAMDLTSTAEFQPTKTPIPTPRPVSMPVDDSKDLIYGARWVVGVGALVALYRFFSRKLSHPKPTTNPKQEEETTLIIGVDPHHAVYDPNYQAIRTDAQGRTIIGRPPKI